MSDGFLFDRIDMAGYDFAIDEELQFTRNVPPNSTKANLTVADVAVTCTGGATDPVVRQRLVERSLSSFNQY